MGILFRYLVFTQLCSKKKIFSDLRKTFFKFVFLGQVLQAIKQEPRFYSMIIRTEFRPTKNINIPYQNMVHSLKVNIQTVYRRILNSQSK